MRYLCLADLHLTGDKPECRMPEENWMGVLDDKMSQVNRTAKDADAVILAGDIFDSWRNTDFAFLNWAMSWFREIRKATRTNKIYTIAGNHDAPYHSYDIDAISRSPYMTLVEAGLFHDLKMSPVPEMSAYIYTDKGEMPESDASMCVAHKGLYQKKKPFPGADESGNVEQFVKLLHKNIKYVVAGDYHTPFTATVEGVLVLNCGSMIRRRADQLTYEPAMHIMDTETCTVEKIPFNLKLPIRRDYIDVAKEQRNMLDELVGSIEGDFEAALNYRDNFENMVADLPDKAEIMKLFNSMM